jgi:hypothetical protein
MSGQNITSADAIIELVIAELYPSGFNLEQFEAQNIFEMGDTDTAEYQRTADGNCWAVLFMVICRGHSIWLHPHRRLSTSTTGKPRR